VRLIAKQKRIRRFFIPMKIKQAFETRSIPGEFLNYLTFAF
jgi:hypothetical protein